MNNTLNGGMHSRSRSMRTLEVSQVSESYNKLPKQLFQKQQKSGRGGGAQQTTCMPSQSGKNMRNLNSTKIYYNKTTDTIS